jgi:hypothetical protein
MNNLLIKKESNIDSLLREVSNCDTEAGERLRYHYTRSNCSKEYAQNLTFSTGPSWLESTEYDNPGLTSLFVFRYSPEGHDYWYKIHTLVESNRRRA